MKRRGSSQIPTLHGAGRGPQPPTIAARLHAGPFPGRRALSHRWPWLAIAAALVLVGVLGAVLAASGVARDDVRTSRMAFKGDSARVVSTLELAVKREQDLVVSETAFLAGNPSASNADLARWLRSVQAFERYPELLGTVRIALVPASRLAAFERRVRGDPPGPLGPGGRFVIAPPGRRPYYCLQVIAESRGSLPGWPAGSDACATAPGLPLMSRDLAQPLVFTVSTVGLVVLAVETPMYRDNLVPATVSARRKRFIGWMATGINPAVILGAALQGHRHMAVELRRAAVGAPPVFTTGKIPRRAQSVSVDLHNGSSVRVFAPVPSGSVFAHANALGALIAGTVITLLLGILVFVLGTGRARALSLVDSKTEELRVQAMTDALTGVANRRLFMEQSRQECLRGRAGQIAVLSLDLDGFKTVNDTHGHAVGDRVLREASGRMAASIRGVDMLARIGGDEFAVLLCSDSPAAAARAAADRIIDAFGPPLRVDRTDVILDVSVGVAVGRYGVNAEELLRQADVALYAAKTAGRGRCELFHPVMDTEARERQLLAEELRRAPERGELVLDYQPIIELASGQAVAVEALVRWQHPGRGLLAPDQFIGIAEREGSIGAVDRWVLAEAAARVAGWNAARPVAGELMLHVNVSARELVEPGYAEHVAATLRAAGLDPHRLVIEVTESDLIADLDHAGAVLAQLLALGTQIALDDFGSGYSSLSYLRSLPINVLKVDRALGDTSDRRAASLLHTVIELGRGFALTVLMEGIETDEQRETIARMGCELAQGFGIARPMSAAALEAWLLDPAAAPGSADPHSAEDHSPPVRPVPEPRFSGTRIMLVDDRLRPSR